MMVFEYEVRFQQLSKYATMILCTKQERVCFFVYGLRLQLRIKTGSMDSAGHSFLDVVNHACTMEELRHEAQGGNDKRVYHQGSYSISNSRGRDSYDSIVSAINSRICPSSLLKWCFRPRRASSSVRVVLVRV